MSDAPTAPDRVPSNGRIALITGASRGIGAATAVLLGQRGYRVAVHHDHNPAEAHHIATRITDHGGDALVVRADLTNTEDVAEMVDTVTQHWGPVEVLIHAGQRPHVRTSFADLRLDRLEDGIAQELRAAFPVTMAVTPAMIAHNYGRLVYLSSVYSRHPQDERIVEGTAKAALDQFVRYLAQELAVYGIPANLVAPANVAGVDARSAGWTDDELWVLGTANTPARLVLPGDVARTIAFFASEDCVTTTGHYAPVNTGLAVH
ncbi:SDR family oxidoreductase [Mycolicibacterium goodii]|uniref:SDR family NAD(P)-dependent oxidoreductase n=1 Tax=Mycolicibacterium goodii TaxID=134601 RepID=UPI001BDCFB3C|nr:SDR family NAD(P)-dependent oxidoreductase [Mycolicibacterium goodii]MBU8808312.1 SDR family oxidoreductase [Mycolicibacterium goodii]